MSRTSIRPIDWRPCASIRQTGTSPVSCPRSRSASGALGLTLINLEIAQPLNAFCQMRTCSCTAIVLARSTV